MGNTLKKKNSEPPNDKIMNFIQESMRTVARDTQIQPYNQLCPTGLNQNPVKFIKVKHKIVILYELICLIVLLAPVLSDWLVCMVAVQEICFQLKQAVETWLKYIIFNRQRYQGKKKTYTHLCVHILTCIFPHSTIQLTANIYHAINLYKTPHMHQL